MMFPQYRHMYVIETTNLSSTSKNLLEVLEMQEWDFILGFKLFGKKSLTIQTVNKIADGSIAYLKKLGYSVSELT